MNKMINDGDPWSPVDTSATTPETVKPETPLEIKGGEVTAHINLGGDASKEDDAKTAAEAEDTEAQLAEKLAALDAAKSGKKGKR